MNGDSRGSAAAESSSHVDSHTSSPATYTKPVTTSQATANHREFDEIFTDEETNVRYVHAQEPHPYRNNLLHATVLCGL